MGFIPNKYQQRVFDWLSSRPASDVHDYNAGINAVAGSGKTTTLVEGMRYIPPRDSIIYAAFNYHIRKELEKKTADIGRGNIDVRTINSLGYALLRGFYNTHRAKLEVDNDGKYYRLAKAYVDIVRLHPDQRRKVIGDIVRLSDLTRSTLTDPEDKALLSGLCMRQGIEPSDVVIGAIPWMLRRGFELVEEEYIIDFTDQLWIPHELSVRQGMKLLPANPVEYLFIDEAQDLSPAQLDVVLRYAVPETRILFCGDPNQSIYGFSGAAHDSYQGIAKRLNAIELPLSICYRCPTSHINLARRVVPRLEARENAAPGLVEYRHDEDLFDHVTEGDLVICRNTAPLISRCIALIRRRIPAKVRGRDIGAGLIDILKSLQKRPDFAYNKLGEMLEDYLEVKKQYLLSQDASEERLQSLKDRVDCIHICAQEFGEPLASKILRTLAKEKSFDFANLDTILLEYQVAQAKQQRHLPLDVQRACTVIQETRQTTSANTVGELIARINNTVGMDELIRDIENLFSDERPTVWFCTIHRAKGLENKTVWIIDPFSMPRRWKGQTREQYTQEVNLLYVALTRAQNRLIFLVPQDMPIEDALQMDFPPTNLYENYNPYYQGDMVTARGVRVERMVAPPPDHSFPGVLEILGSVEDDAETI